MKTVAHQQAILDPNVTKNNSVTTKIQTGYELTLTFITSVTFPDMTYMVDWALKTIYLLMSPKICYMKMITYH